MGAGHLPCEKVIPAHEEGTQGEKGAPFGRFMGFWSAAVSQHESGFADIAESGGRNRIAEATVIEYRRAPLKPSCRSSAQKIKHTY